MPISSKCKCLTYTLNHVCGDTMKIIAINGSPRKKNNTATLLQHALAGAKAAHPEGTVETELVHLYDLRYQGCKSCFACKRINGKSQGKCAIIDELQPVLGDIAEADGIILGTPVYFSGITGQMRSFCERLLFAYLNYDKSYSSCAPKKMPSAFIYTMNVPYDTMVKAGYLEQFAPLESFFGRVFSSKPEVLYANNTYQFDDYTKYKAETFSEEEKARHRATQFPIDCKKASELGAAMTRQGKAQEGQAVQAASRP